MLLFAFIMALEYALAFLGRRHKPSRSERFGHETEAYVPRQSPDSVINFG